jgi:apolipoprotein N-acyltransferase
MMSGCKGRSGGFLGSGLWSEVEVSGERNGSERAKVASVAEEEAPREPFAPGVTRAWLLGALFVLSYALGTPGYDVPALPFVCLAPFLALTAEAPSVRRAARRGWVAGTAASLPLYYWIAHTVAVKGKQGWPLGVLGAFLVSAYIGAYFSVAGATARRLQGRYGGRGLWAFPVAWVGLELARSYLFSGFPWMLLGYTLAGSPLLRQAADLAGVSGLSFLLALSGASLYLSSSAVARRAWGRGLLLAIPAVAAATGLCAYGAFSPAAREPSPPAGPPLAVGIAQGGIDQSEKWDPANQVKTLDVYEELTTRARESGARVVVWPETAAPFFYGWDPGLTRRLDGIGARAGGPLLFGAPWYDPEAGGKVYNSVFHMDDRGVVRGRYDKRHLVPFGEYVPLRRILFFMKKMTFGENDFSAGTGPVLFDVAGTRMAASVCYEAIFPPVIRDGVAAGAGILVNVTNDAWFGDTVAPHQHLAMARLRCVEFRRPMVRAANSGISAVIDSRGEVVASLGLFRRGIVTAEVRPGSGRTPYEKSGEIFGISCSIIAALTLVFPLRGPHGIRMAGRKDRGA